MSVCLPVVWELSEEYSWELNYGWGHLPAMFVYIQFIIDFVSKTIFPYGWSVKVDGTFWINWVHLEEKKLFNHSSKVTEHYFTLKMSFLNSGHTFDVLIDGFKPMHIGAELPWSGFSFSTRDRAHMSSLILSKGLYFRSSIWVKFIYTKV